jgi:hypothetical protein
VLEISEQPAAWDLFLDAMHKIVIGRVKSELVQPAGRQAQADQMQTLQTGLKRPFSPRVRHAFHIGNRVRIVDVDQWLALDGDVPLIGECLEQLVEVRTVIGQPGVGLVDVAGQLGDPDRLPQRPGDPPHPGRPRQQQPADEQ